jgi:hypothetical protein
VRWYHISTVLMGLAPAAHATLLPDGGVTAQDVASVMKSANFTTEITTDKEGDPLIRSSTKGSKFGVYFYGCRKSRCDSIQFSAGFDAKDVTPAKIADWNRTMRFGRAYLDASFEPWVEMDLDLEHGGTTDGLANDLNRWLSVLSEFNKFISK